MGVDIAVIAQIADGYAHHLRLELLDRVFHVGDVVVGEHQVKDLKAVTVLVQMAGHVSQTNGQRPSVHAAHQPVVAVGRNQ